MHNAALYLAGAVAYIGVGYAMTRLELYWRHIGWSTYSSREEASAFMALTFLAWPFFILLWGVAGVCDNGLCWFGDVLPGSAKTQDSER